MAAVLGLSSGNRPRGWDTAILNCWRRLALGRYAALPSILLFASAGSLLWLLLRVWRGGDGTQPLPFGPGLATAGAGAVACQWFALPLGANGAGLKGRQ